MLLRTIDSLWVEHLTEVDDMRRGIGLRGYAQQDPLNEFRKEAYRLYEELSGLIRRQVATTIFRVTVKPRARRPVPLAGPGQPARPLGPARTPIGDGAIQRHERVQRRRRRAGDAGSRRGRAGGARRGRRRAPTSARRRP